MTVELALLVVLMAACVALGIYLERGRALIARRYAPAKDVRR